LGNIIFGRRRKDLGVFWLHRRSTSSTEWNANFILGGHARRSRQNRKTRPRDRWKKPGRPRGMRRLQSRILRILLRRPGWQQTGNLLSGKSRHCGVKEFGEEWSAD